MSSENSKSIQQRIAGRKIGQELIDSIKHDYQQQHTLLSGVARAFRLFCDEVDPIPQVEPTLVMSDSEAKAFEEEKIQYGIHHGTSFGELPNDYMDFLIANAERLVRYSKSAIYQRRVN